MRPDYGFYSKLFNKKIGKRLIKKLIENAFQSMALAFTTFTVYTLNSVQQISRTLFTLNEWFLTMRPIGLALLAAFWAAWYSKGEIKFWHPHFFCSDSHLNRSERLWQANVALWSGRFESKFSKCLKRFAGLRKKWGSIYLEMLGTF